MANVNMHQKPQKKSSKVYNSQGLSSNLKSYYFILSYKITVKSIKKINYFFLVKYEYVIIKNGTYGNLHRYFSFFINIKRNG